MGLNNRDPDKHYVLVDSADTNQGIGHYESMGYQMEEYSGEGGVRLRSVRPTKGQPVEKNGSMLMSCSKERHQEIIEYGEDGDSGLEANSIVEQRIIRRRSGSDDMRGIGRALNHAGASLSEWQNEGVRTFEHEI